MADAFISYAREDTELVRRLQEALSEAGLDIWIDVEGIYAGEQFWPQIQSAIEGADHFVFVISHHSVVSPYCRREVRHAVEHHKRILPVLHQEPEASELPAEVASAQWLFLRPEDDFAAAVTDLQAAMESDPDWVRSHTRLVVRTREWEMHGRDTSFALRGEDLEAAEIWLAEAGRHEEPRPTDLQTEYIFASRKAATRRQRLTLGSVTLGLVVAVVLALFAWNQRQEAVSQRDRAEQRERLAEARYLAAQANLLRAQDERLNERGTLLAVESMRRFVDLGASPLEADQALRQGLGLLARPVGRVPHEWVPADVRLGVDGRFLVVLASDRKTVRVLEVSSGLALAESSYPAGIADLAIDNDGSRLALVGADDVVMILEVSGGRELLRLTPGAGLRTIAFTPDGARLLMLTASGVVSTWDLEGGDVVAQRSLLSFPSLGDRAERDSTVRESSSDVFPKAR